MLRYLRSSRKKLALLLNFGLPSLEYRRFVLNEDSVATCGEPDEARLGRDDSAESESSV